MKILAIDPGTAESAWVIYDPKEKTVLQFGQEPNKELLRRIHQFGPRFGIVMVIEMIKSYGNVMGDSVIETCVWIGRFIQAWGGEYEKLPRKSVVTQLCNNPRAKDSNVRRALLDRFGKVKCAGIKNDMWSAFAVGVAWDELNKQSAAALERALK